MSGKKRLWEEVITIDGDREVGLFIRFRKEKKNKTKTQ